MKIQYTAELTSAFHHGAGTSGNTANLRTQEVVREDGSFAQVPFLSANSIRHGLREALAWHLVKTLDVKPGTLTKGEVALLWAGGGITKTGANFDVDLARKAATLIPGLGLLGYAAGSDIISGTLRVSDAILVCEENAQRLPIPAEKKAAFFRDEEFGTRHDLATSAPARFINYGEATDTLQMIYSLQVLKAGSTLYGTIQTDASSTPEQDKTLAAAWHLWAPNGAAFLGAKNAVGYGAAQLRTEEEIPHEVKWLTEHYLAHGEEVLETLREVAA